MGTNDKAVIDRVWDVALRFMVPITLGICTAAIHNKITLTEHSKDIRANADHIKILQEATTQIQDSRFTDADGLRLQRAIENKFPSPDWLKDTMIRIERKVDENSLAIKEISKELKK